MSNAKDLKLIYQIASIMIGEFTTVDLQNVFSSFVQKEVLNQIQHH